MLREEAEMVKNYLKKGGYLNEEMNEIIEDNVSEEVRLDMHLLKGRYELQQLIGYTVDSVLDTTNEEDRNGSLLTFRKMLPECGNSFIDLSLSGDGNIYISDTY